MTLDVADEGYFRNTVRRQTKYKNTEIYTMSNADPTENR